MHYVCIVIVADQDIHWRGGVRDLSVADVRWRESGGLCRGWDVAGMFVRLIITQSHPTVSFPVRIDASGRLL